MICERCEGISDDALDELRGIELAYSGIVLPHKKLQPSHRRILLALKEASPDMVRRDALKQVSGTTEESFRVRLVELKRMLVGGVAIVPVHGLGYRLLIDRTVQGVR